VKQLLGAVVAATAITLSGPATALAGQPSAPGIPDLPSEGGGLAIHLDDGVTSAKDGDQLTYTVTLRNADKAAPAQAAIELTLPVGARSIAVNDGGDSPEPWFARWTLQVPPDGTATVSANFQAGPPVKDAKGYAATACVVRNFVRQLCASDIDQVPGAADIHATGSSSGPDLSWIVPCAIGALLLGGVGLALYRRTKAATPPPNGEDHPVPQRL
jgi:hypothetical protein